MGERSASDWSFRTLLAAPRANPSTEDLGTYSVVWSTTTLPTVDAGRGRGRTITRRFDLRVSALLLAGCLALSPHCAAATLACGGLPFVVFLVLIVVLVGNVMRHFEIYLGEWSVGGPGCAFRIVPILDGIGIAMCLLSLMRATLSSVTAAIALFYVLHAINDQPLPYTQCRDFNLAAYPAVPFTPPKTDKGLMRKPPPHSMLFYTRKNVTRLRRAPYFADTSSTKDAGNAVRMGTVHVFRRNALGQPANASRQRVHRKMFDYSDYVVPFESEEYKLRAHRTHLVKKRNSLLCKPDTPVCKEAFHLKMPFMLPTPSYNFFYLDLMYVRQDHDYQEINAKMAFAILCTWAFIWFILLVEMMKWNQIVWNSAYTWMVIGVAFWTLTVFIIVAHSIDSLLDVLSNLQSFVHMKTLFAASSALELALFTHACGFGSEIILGKGLNYYAGGHMDRQLAKETIICSAWSMAICLVNGLTVLICSNKEAVHPLFAAGKMFNYGSHNLWIFPLYAACIPTGNFMHIMSLFVFGGLMLTNVILTIYYVKTSLHCLFEYQVKLIMFQQAVVFGTCLLCCLLTLPYASRGGLFLLESMDNMVTGLTSTAVCLLELLALLYMYNSRDFVNDMLNSNVNNKCPTRVYVLWKSLPIFIAIAVLLKIATLLNVNQPAFYSVISVIPVLVILLSVPVKGVINGIAFYRSHQVAE